MPRAFSRRRLRLAVSRAQSCGAADLRPGHFPPASRGCSIPKRIGAGGQALSCSSSESASCGDQLVEFSRGLLDSVRTLEAIKLVRFLQSIVRNHGPHGVIVDGCCRDGPDGGWRFRLIERNIPAVLAGDFGEVLVQISPRLDLHGSAGSPRMRDPDRLCDGFSQLRIVDLAWGPCVGCGKRANGHLEA